MIEIVIPVRDFYRNIPGQGKVKELTKGKSYECKIDYNYGSKYFSIITDLGDKKTYCKKNMFITKSKSRDNKIKQILK
jgi:hypothetical protein